MTATIASSVLPTVLSYLAAGRSVLPIAPGEKRPSIVSPAGEVIGLSWEAYQTASADEGTVRAWFLEGRLMGVGIACGAVSGAVLDGVTYGLEILDIDDEETLEAFIETCNFQGYSALLQRLLHQRTPGKAGHFAYLCQTWQGNTVLARRAGVEELGEPRAVTLIETRGAGGQAVVAPTPPGIHPEHPERGYELVRGSWNDLPIITSDERQALWDLARSFNTYVAPERVHSARGAGRPGTSGNRPGDWLNRSADMVWWRALLERHGWSLVHTRGAIQFWQRPGKEGQSWSATLGACGEYFYVFSSNAAPFEPDRAYSPFSAYALLEHGGDFQAAARALIPQRFAAEWPALEEGLTLIEQLLSEPDARLAMAAVPRFVAYDRDAWTATRHAIKGVLGAVINLNDLDAAWKKTRRQARATASSPADVGDPLETEEPAHTIYITTQMTTVVNAMQAAIAQLPEAPRLLQRAQQLCHIARGVTPPKWLERSHEAPVIVPADPAYLRELAAQAAAWKKYDKRADAWEDALPPTWAVETLLARRVWPFPLLEGVVTAPTLRPDGSVLDLPGYDPDTGLFLAVNGVDYPPIPQRPTLDAARTAIGTLHQVFIDFPWLASHHFSATLAAVLALAGRYAIRGSVPLHAVRSTNRGSGKSLLVDAVSLSATGRPAPRWPQVQEEEEERKRLLTLALDGDTCTHIDNVTRPLGSPALNAALTASTFKDRILGKSESREAPMHVVFFASGNNMTFKSDTARRVVPIDLDPKMERPEERTNFQHSPLLPWVRHEHPRLLAAALTVLKAYFTAGCPAQNITPLGSFEAWSDLVRQALIWAGEADPCEGRKDIEAQSDPEFERLATLLDAWEKCYETKLQTLKRVLQDIDLYTQDQAAPPDKWDDLFEALGSLDRRFDGKRLNPQRIGEGLMKWAGRPIDGKRLVKGGTVHRVAEWKIELISEGDVSGS